MSVRICRTEKFIPPVGQPVYQIQEELTLSGVKQLLPPRNPTSEELQGMEDSFAAAQQEIISTLTQDKSTLENQVATLTSERDAALTQATTLNADKEALTEANATLTAQLAAANARITALLTEVPYDPRVIEASAFIARISSSEIMQLAASSDQNIQAIWMKLLQYKENDWRIELDSQPMLQAVGYLQFAGLVSGERAAALLRDGTRAESYVNDGST